MVVFDFTDDQLRDLAIECLIFKQSQSKYLKLMLNDLVEQQSSFFPNEIPEPGQKSQEKVKFTKSNLPYQ